MEERNISLGEAFGYIQKNLLEVGEVKTVTVSIKSTKGQAKITIEKTKTGWWAVNG